MSIIICPGIHSPELSNSFIQNFQYLTEDSYLSLPTESTPYSAIAIAQWLERQPLVKTEPLIFIAFSAGVVGSIGAALNWQLGGGKVQSFIAFDGWGMPLAGKFPIYRVSHDYFTHWSSGLLGGGNAGFYAEPEVEHLDLWRSPANISGWQEISTGCKTRITLNGYLAQILNGSPSNSN